MDKKTSVTIALVQKTGKQFGQRIGHHEAKRIAALLLGWRK